ncbi:methylated-DNA--[protein]-cysteine S-methyltransferase [Bacillus sp. Marseille-P3661]|uniref:methylated-DNA--[protein]-cysteine S-methyltransferase n=1 Tax=Bacillus sp. Marseille-P3661 TaxID=1936234 RepID=UPI000C8378C8|nr:methylated-DNA--[protein]-cysteine S-methyltransferase [Bacillus sp. Marseille-P3661]
MMRPLIYYDEMESPIGPLTIVTTDKGICNIEFGRIEGIRSILDAWVKKYFLKSELSHNPEKLSQTINQLSQYFYGERNEFNLPIDLYGTSFQKKVWNELCKIKYGTTKSYKDVAQSIYAPKAVRAIGTAIGRNPVPILVPCHRVIGSNGSLVGYNGGLDKKEKLLMIEKSLKQSSK